MTGWIFISWISNDNSRNSAYFSCPKMLKSQKSHNSNYLKLAIKECTVLWAPLYIFLIFNSWFFCKIQDWRWKFPSKGILASEHDVWTVKIMQKLYIKPIKHLRKYRVFHSKSADFFSRILKSAITHFCKWNGLFQKWEINYVIKSV